MGRRERAREEAAFLRGDVGVDGQATAQEQRDEAEVEKDKAREQLMRGQTWLGREFMTWLLWRSEEGAAITEQDGEGVVPLYVGRIILRGVHGEVVELAAKGTMAPYSMQVRRALDDGLLVHSGRVRFTRGERTWEATLDAEFLDVRSAKLPELLTEEEDDRLTERLDLTEQLSAMIDALVEAFLAIRASKTWSRDVVPTMKAWMRGEGDKPGATIERARRAAG